MIFDPYDMRDVRLVSTVDDSRSARNAAYAYDREREQYEQDQRERSMRSLGFGQRSSVCG